MGFYMVKCQSIALASVLSVLLLGCGGGSSGASASATHGAGSTAGSGGYFLLASAGSQNQTGTITFANGAQTAPMPALVAISAASPASGTVTIEASGQTPTFLPSSSVFEGTVNAGRISNLRSRFGVYFKGGQLYKVDQAVASGGSPAPQVVSTLASTDVCGNGGFPTMDPYSSGNDFANASHSWLFFRAPGTDGTCDTVDDVFRAVRMDMGAGTSALTIDEPLTEILGSDGSFAGLLVRKGNQIQRLDAALTSPTNLFTVDPATFVNVGARFGAQAGIWFFTEGVNLWGVNLASPGTRVALDTFASGEALAPAGASDGVNVFMAINTSTGARVLSINQALTATTVLSSPTPIEQLALTPTRLVIAGSMNSSSGPVLAVPKGGGGSVALGTFNGGTVNPIITSGENVYFPSYTFATWSTVVVASDGSNTVTLSDTQLLKGIAPSSFGLSDGSSATNYAVVLASGIVGSTSGATLRAVEGSTRNTLLTYGAFASPGPVLAPTLNADPLQFGQSGLISMPGSNSSIVLYYFKSDGSGLVKATN